MLGSVSSRMDFALHRQFDFPERVTLRFRSEFFNHPKFGSSRPFRATRKKLAKDGKKIAFLFRLFGRVFRLARARRG